MKKYIDFAKELGWSFVDIFEKFIPVVGIVVMAVLVCLALTGCVSRDIQNMGGEPTNQGTRTLILPDGRGCEGKLRFTGGGYASIHYNFQCDDGRLFVNLTNAEIK